MSEDGTTEFPDDAAAFVQQHIEQEHGYLSWLGTRVDSVDYGHVTMSIPFDEKLTNDEPELGSAPQVHGGVAATLVDTAGAVAQRTMFDDPLAGGLATVNLNVNYLRRASGDLTATAEVVRAGGTIGVSAVTVEGPTPDGEDRHPVATGQVAYRLFRDVASDSDRDE
ncbi:PaaI family thioesterase [Salinigranum salinum]|uniref:PaaI family thioesterase n=1 Tax=Salinigranum salinum TaxID=1364937 RepID=UPI00126089F6|nr:PaaI family thioesterase [Salinigranum salinum]